MIRQPPGSYRCQWTVPQEERARTHQFSLQPVPDVEGATVNLPHAWNPFTLPADGECNGPGGDLPGSTDGKDVFAITIDVGKVKKADVQLQYTP